MEGGILRAKPAMQATSAPAIAAKLHFALKRGAAGIVMIQWLPDTLHCDVRMPPAGGMFTPGSYYMGVVSWPLLSSQEYLLQMAFPQSHPQPGQADTVEYRSLP